MRSQTLTIPLALFAVLCLSGPSTALAQEKKIARKDVPTAVLSAFEKSYPNAKPKGFSTEVEKGKTYYEIESIEGNTTRDILYLVDGTVAEVEEGVSASGLPASVKTSVAKKYPEGKITRAERTTRNSVVTYELRIKSGKSQYELVVDPGGKIVSEKKAGGKMMKED